MAGIRITEIPFDNVVNGHYDLVHVYKRFPDGSFKSARTPLSAVGLEGPRGIEGEKGNPGTDGDNGLLVAQLVCYKLFPEGTDYTSVVAPASPGSLPNDQQGTYNLATRTFTPPNGWVKVVPSGDGDVYVAHGVAQGVVNPEDNDYSENIIPTWDDAEISGAKGLTGQPGQSGFVGTIFTRQATQPIAPKGGYVDFTNNELIPPGPNQAPQNGTPIASYGNYNAARDSVQWYQHESQIPADNNEQLWNCSHNFSIEGVTGNDPSNAPYDPQLGQLSEEDLNNPSWAPVRRGARDGNDGRQYYFLRLYHRGTGVQDSNGDGYGDFRPMGGSFDFTNNRMTVRDNSNGGAFGNSLGAVVATADGDHLVDGNDQAVTNRYIDMPTGYPEGTWSETVPPEAPSAGNKLPLWETSAVVSIQGLEGQDTSITWHYPKLIHTPSIDGNQGDVTAVARIYIRANTEPAKPTTGEFSFDTRTWVSNNFPEGWAEQPYRGDGSGTLYAVTGIMTMAYDPTHNNGAGGYPNATCTVADGGSPATDSLVWSDVVVSPEEGLPGGTTFFATAYTRSGVDLQSSSNPDYRPVGGGYDFDTSVLTPPINTNGNTENITWHSNIPVGSLPIYLCTQIFTILGTSGADNKTSNDYWTEPRLLAQNGAAGINAVNNTRVPIYYGSTTDLENAKPIVFTDLSLTVDLNKNNATFGQILFSKANDEPKQDINSNNEILDQNGVATGWTTEVPPGKPYVYIAYGTAADGDETGVDAISANEWTGVNTFIRKGDDGLAGYGNNSVFLYKRVNTPTLALNQQDVTGPITYYIFDQGDNKAGDIVVPPGSSLNGWLSAIPDSDANGHYLWAIRATASSRDNSDSIPATEWSEPFLFSQNPFDLESTTISHTVYAYKRSATTPVDNPGTCTVRLSGEALAGTITTGTLANNWSKTPPAADPANPQPLYLVTAKAAGSVTIDGPGTEEDTIAANEWSDPVIFGNTGLQGERGPDGNVVREIELYKRTGLNPAGVINPPRSDGVFDFSDNSWTFTDNTQTDGWSFDLPVKDANDKMLWVTFATATSSFTNGGTDTIQGYTSELDDGDWSDARAQTIDGESVVFLGPYANLQTLLSDPNVTLAAGMAYFDTTDGRSYIFRRKPSGEDPDANNDATGTEFDGAEVNLKRELFSEKGGKGDPGTSINYRGQFSDNTLIPNVKVNDTYKDISGSPPFLLYICTSISPSIVWEEFVRDGEKGTSITNVSQQPGTGGLTTEVTLGFDGTLSNGQTTDTFIINNGLDAEPLSANPDKVVRTPGSTTGQVSLTFENSTESYNTVFNLNDGDGINYVETENHTVDGVVLGKNFNFWKDSNPYVGNENSPSFTVGPVLNGSDGNSANVAIIYATDVDGTNASYEKTYTAGSENLTRKFVQYYEYNPANFATDLNGKPNTSRFVPNSGAPDNLPGNLHVAGSFVQWQGDPGNDGNDGGTIVPIYASVRQPTIGTAGHNVSLQQVTGTTAGGDLIERKFVNFYEKAHDFVIPDLDTFTQGAQNFINGLTFVNLEGIQGVSLSQVERDENTGVVSVRYTDNRTPDQFTLVDGKDATFKGAERNLANQTVAITFNTNGQDVTKNFDLADGQSITSITPSTDENGNTVVVVKGKIKGTSAAETEIGTFTVNRGLSGVSAAVAVVYSTDIDGTNASYDRSEATQFVKYHEYTGDVPDISQFEANTGALSGGFVQFKGDPGNSIVPIFATDASGSNPSIYQSAARSFVNFYEKPFGTIVDSNTDLAALIAAQSPALTFVNIEGPVKDAGLLAYPAFKNADFDTIKFDQDENALKLQDESGIDDEIGMAFPAINVENAGAVEFDVTFKGTESDNNGVYIRVYETSSDLAPGKLAISPDRDGPELSIIQTTGIIDIHTGASAQRYGDSNTLKGFGTKESNTAENIGVTTSYQTSSFRYIPHPTAKYASLNILNWSGMGTKGLFVKPIIPRILGKNVETVTRTGQNITFTNNDGTTDTIEVKDGSELEVTDVERDTDKNSNTYGRVTMSFRVGDQTSTKTFDTAGIGIKTVQSEQVTVGSTTFTRLSVIDDNGALVGSNVDIPNGLPGAAAHVAIVYADDVNGTNASYDAAKSGTELRKFIRYHEFTGDAVNDKPAATTFLPNTGPPNSIPGTNYEANSFVQYVGVDGKSVTPVYSSTSQPATIEAVTLTPDSNSKFVTFFEKLGGITAGFTNLTSDEQTSLLGSTFVRYVGADGTSVTIKGSKADTNSLPTAANSTLGDGYIIGNDLYIYTGNDNTTDNGYENVGVIRGPQGIQGNSITPVYASDATGTGATLTQTAGKTFIFYYIGGNLTESGLSAALGALNPDPRDGTGGFTDFKGEIGVTNITVSSSTISGRSRTYDITFTKPDGNTFVDDFTVEDGVSITGVNNVDRNNTTGVTTIEFQKNDNTTFTTPEFTIADGDGISHVEETDTFIGGVSGKRIDIYSDASPFKTQEQIDNGETQGTPLKSFTILNGDPINVVAVYAKDATGTDATFTLPGDDTLPLFTHVQYFEYAKSDGIPLISTFQPEGTNANGYIKFVGEDAEQITPIYATDADGTGANVVEQTNSTHINFFEGSISSIDGDTVTRASDEQTFSIANDLTFIKIKGEKGVTGSAGKFFNSFEPGEEFDAWFLENTGGSHTFAADTSKKYTGTQSAKIATTTRDTDPTGTIGGVRVQLPDDLMALFAGNLIEVKAFARKDEGSGAASFFEMAYSTNNAGNSGWKRFNLTTSFAPYTFKYNVPVGNSSPDYLGIQGDGNGGAFFVDNITISVVSVGIESISPDANDPEKLIISYDDPNKTDDEFTVKSGRDLKITGVESLGNNQFRFNFQRGEESDSRYDAATDVFNSAQFTIPPGDGINAIIESALPANADGRVDTQLAIYLDSAPYYQEDGVTPVDPLPNAFRTVTVVGGVPGASSNIFIVFADDEDGTDASAVAGTGDNKRRFVKYHEYTGTKPTADQFDPDSSSAVSTLTGGFVEYVGTDGAPGPGITAIYATSSDGQNASTDNTPVNGVKRSFVNFFEGAITSITGTGAGSGITIQPKVGSSFKANTKLFVNLIGPAGNDGSSITNVTRTGDELIISYSGGKADQRVDIYNGASVELESVSRVESGVNKGKLKFVYKNPTGRDENGDIVYGPSVTSFAPLADGASVTGFTSADSLSTNGLETSDPGYEFKVVGTRIQFLSGEEGQNDPREFGSAFTIARGLPAPEAGVQVVYASDPDGSNASYTITDNNITREFVAYVEFDGLIDEKPASATAAKTLHISRNDVFVKFIGEDGSNANITTVYATDANGANKSLSNADVPVQNGLDLPRTFVTFVEAALTTEAEVSTYFSAGNPGENETFVQIKGDTGNHIYVAYSSSSTDTTDKTNENFYNVVDSNGNYLDAWGTTADFSTNWRAEKEGINGTWQVMLGRGETGPTGPIGLTGKPNGHDPVRNNSNKNDGNILYHNHTQRTVLSAHISTTDTAIGLVYPAFNVEGWYDSGESASFNIPIKLSSPRKNKPTGRLYIRFLEYDEELPAGKSYVGEFDRTVHSNATFNTFSFDTDVNKLATDDTANHTFVRATNEFYDTEASVKIQSNEALVDPIGNNGKGNGIYQPLTNSKREGQREGDRYVTMEYRYYSPSTGGADEVSAALTFNNGAEDSEWQTVSIPSEDRDQWKQAKFVHQITTDVIPDNTNDYFLLHGDDSNGIVYIDRVRIYSAVDLNGAPKPDEGSDYQHPEVQDYSRRITFEKEYVDQFPESEDGRIRRLNTNTSGHPNPNKYAYENVRIGDSDTAHAYGPDADGANDKLYSFEYFPSKTAKYASLAILNWQADQDRPSASDELSDLQLQQQADKAFSIGAVVPTHTGKTGAEGNPGAHGFTTESFELYKQIGASRAVPARPGAGTLSIGGGQLPEFTFSQTVAQNKNNAGWTANRPSSEEGKVIYSVNGSIRYSAGDEDESVRSTKSFAGNWGDVTRINEALPRTAPAVSRTAKYRHLNASHVGSDAANTVQGQYSFAQKGTDKNSTTGYRSSFANTNNEPLSETDKILSIKDSIGQIIFHRYGTPDGSTSVDNTDFWGDINNTLQILWSYPDKKQWILFRRTGNVDNTGNARSIDVEVVDHSENIENLEDLPFVHDATSGTTDQDQLVYNGEIGQDVEFGYTASVRSHEIFLYKRNGPTLPANGERPTDDITYKFSDGTFTGTANLNGWNFTAPSRDQSLGPSDTTQAYLWRIHATASSSTDTDTIPKTEWSTPELIAQDGVSPPDPDQIVSFTKELFTRTNKEPNEVPWLSENGWVGNNSYRPQDGILVELRTDAGAANTNKIDEAEARGGTVAQRLSTNEGIYKGSSNNLLIRFSDSTDNVGGQKVRWFDSIPPSDDENYGGKYLYVISSSIYDTSGGSSAANTTATIAQNTWTTPVRLTKDGTGLNTATARIYKRTTGANPAVPGSRATGFPAGRGGGSEYFFFKSGIANRLVIPQGASNPEGWSVNIPTAGGGTLWVSRATAASDGDSDIISSSEWGVPEKLTADGTSLIFIGKFTGGQTATNAASRTEYETKIAELYTTNGKAIIPANSYHIERDTEVRSSTDEFAFRSVLFTGYFNTTLSDTNALAVAGKDAGDELTDTEVQGLANNSQRFECAKFETLTIDGAQGPSGSSIRLREPGNSPGGTTTSSIDAGVTTTTTTYANGNFKQITGGDNDGDGFWDTSGAVPNPQENDIARIGLEGRIFIYDGTAWTLLTRDGKEGPGGTPGLNGKAVFICYNENAVDDPPVPPPAVSNGDWDPNNFNADIFGANAGTEHPDRWYNDISDVPVAAGETVGEKTNWISQKTAIPAPKDHPSIPEGDPTGSVNWDPAILIAGTAGLPGKETAFIEVFIRSELKPSIPINTDGNPFANGAAYDFQSDKLIPPLNGNHSTAVGTDGYTNTHPRWFRTSASTFEGTGAAAGTIPDPDEYRPVGQGGLATPNNWQTARYYSAANGGNHDTNIVAIPERLRTAKLWRATALASIDAGNNRTPDQMVDSSIQFTSVKEVKFSGAELGDLNIDLVIDAVQGRGLRKIVTTTPVGGQIITQERYNALISNNPNLKEQQGWNSTDVPENDTVYFVF